MQTLEKSPFTFDEMSQYFMRAGICSMTLIVAENLSENKMWNHLDELEQKDCSAWIRNHFAKTVLV